MPALARPQPHPPAPDAAVDLARLADALRLSRGGLLAVAVFGSEAGRETAMRRLASRLRGVVPLRRVRLTADAPFLYEHLTGRLAPDHRAFSVYGLEDLPPETLRRALAHLQLKREAIARLRVPVVLWLPRRLLREVARRAPDFFAWRGGLYELDSLI